MEDVELLPSATYTRTAQKTARGWWKKKTGKRPFASTDYRQLLSHCGIDAVFVASDCETHVEIAGSWQNPHYRLRNDLNRNCENHPTHELGPIAKILNVNRGNRMVSLVSVAYHVAGMEDYTAQHADVLRCKQNEKALTTYISQVLFFMFCQSFTQISSSAYGRDRIQSQTVCHSGSLCSRRA